MRFSAPVLSFCLLLGLGLTAGPAGAADDPRRPLAATDFDAWRSLGNPVLSRDGRWLAYSDMPQEGDGELVIRELASGRERRVAVGALPPAPTTASEENPERAAPRRDVTIAFTGDSTFVVATVFPTLAESRAAARAGKKPAEAPKEGLVAVELATGAATRIERVKNFQLPARAGAWLATLHEAPAGETRDSKLGTDLVLRRLPAGPDRVLPDVTEYAFARDGRTLLYAVSAKDDRSNGVYAVTPGDTAAPQVLAAGPGRYRKLAWDRRQTQAAFATDRAEPTAPAPRFALYLWARGPNPAAEVLSPATAGLPAGWSVSGDATPAFSFDGGRLLAFTASAPRPPDARLAALTDSEKVALDIWHWRADRLPPSQKVSATRDRQRSYLGVLDLATRHYTQVADLTLPAATASDDAAFAFGLDDRAYRRRYDYDGTYQDLYLVDTATGTRRLLQAELGEQAGPRWSHNGRWLAYFADGQWFAIDVRDGSKRALTAGLPVSFADEQHDLPQAAPSYGAAGWTRDGDSLLLYDRFDVWQVFPDGRPARNLTAGAGRAQRIQFRVQNTEPAEPGEDRRGLDPAQPLILRGESEETRASGFFRASLAAPAAPARLLWADKNYRYAGRAQDAGVLLLTASRFDEFPDLHTAAPDFSGVTKVSAGGAQLVPFLWGSAELVRYRNADGLELAATLYKPANFDPAKQYPLIVYLYERLTQVVHQFTPPAPSHYLNPAFYASNGYLVLMPDIVYTAGRPGDSALRCVLPALDEVVRRGFVDERAVGIQGHSWGGYQIAYLVTQTTRFRAAAAGAVVGNMTSAYAGIRWGSGRPRQFQYEKTQSRLGPSLYADPRPYLENSPVFQAGRVQTPLLLLHNDQDDAVPWLQGIEFFLALRRLGKEAWLLNYNGEFHGLRRRADQQDYARRMHQFFDHYLKGAPLPAWMAEGVPYLERETEALDFRAAQPPALP